MRKEKERSVEERPKMSEVNCMKITKPPRSTKTQMAEGGSKGGGVEVTWGREEEEEHV